MTATRPSEALREELLALASRVAAWSTEERDEAIETLGGLAMIAGTAGHADHVRVAEALVHLRSIIRFVEEIGEDDQTAANTEGDI